MEEKGNLIVKTFNHLVEERTVLEKNWKDAYTYTNPLRGQLFGSGGSIDGTTIRQSAAADQASKIFDSTASDAVSLLAASMMSGITPSASQWFQFRLSGFDYNDLPYDIRVWLDNANKQIFSMIHNSSNYNAEVLEAMEDMATVGMFGLFISKQERGNYVFEHWALDSLYVVENPKTKMIDTVYRIYTLTAEQAVNEFGEDKLPNSIVEAYKNNKNTTKKYEFIHCIKPRKVKGKIAKEMPIASIYVEKQSKMIVRESGFNEMPVVIPRWSKIPMTSYAVGPTDKALPDIKTLNKVVSMMLSNAEMAIAGTFIAKNDGYLNPNTIQIGPRKIVFAADVSNIKPLTSGGDFRIAFEEIKRLQLQIKSVMMADELEPIQKNYASATEVSTRAQLIRQILGPIFARMQSEFLEPLLNRCFQLALRDGSLGPIPPALAQGNVEIIPEYISPMARAQRMEDVSAMDRFEQSLAASSQLNPGILDVYDLESAARKKATLLGVPADLVRSKEQLLKIRNDQAKAQQAQQAAAQQQAMMDPQMLQTVIKGADSPGIQNMINNVVQQQKKAA